MSRLLRSFATNGIRSAISTVPRYSRAMSSGFSSGDLHLTFQDDGTAVVTMKKEDYRFCPESMNDWHHVFDEVEKTPGCRALVTTGQGDNYCNGLDLEYVKTFTNHKRQFAELVDRFNRMLVRLLVFPVPTVAAINGHTFTGGALWALGHDMRVMRKDKGWFCLDLISHNSRFATLQMEMMRAKISSAEARTQAILYARRFTSAEALHYGIVDKMADQSQLLDVSKEMVNQILGGDEINRDYLNLCKKDLYQHVLVAPRMPTEVRKPLKIPPDVR